jgi:uncharacterized membrane protein YsdA (DUF1294 family)
MNNLIIIIALYLIWNCYVFVTIGIDKRRAKLKRWRIPEARLLLMGAVLGGVGLYAGMKYFRHKTKHVKFIIGAPVLMIMNFIVLGFFLLKFSRFL